MSEKKDEKVDESTSSQTQTDVETMFDAEYVKQLRAENAKWRKQTKELQKQLDEVEIVEVEDTPTPKKPVVPSAIKPKADTSPAGTRSLKEIKNDPVARAKIRDWYREKLASSRVSLQ
jgi:hypothetical protein